jgi:hypothetical protein
MTERSQKLLDEILALSDDERTLILDSLMEREALRHAGFASSEVANSWDPEIAKRLEEIDSGKVKAIPAEEFWQMMQAKNAKNEV